jgi:tetratricopeptide (TPR) repeat protein
MASAQPWSQGVSEAQKADAKAKLEEGNALYVAAQYTEALAKYEEALKSWDHPAIRFNVVRCLIQLGRSAEASQNLETALKYGKEPFEEAVYQEALGYQKLLANTTGEIEVKCSQEGAVLKFDRDVLIGKCPGSAKKRVDPGQHSVIATKDGFLTKEMPVIVIGGKQQAVDVKLVPLDKAAKVVHRWPQWIPWVVFGGSLAVVGVGAFLELDAQSQMSDYDNDVANFCGGSGCNLDNPMTPDEMKTAKFLNDEKSAAESRDKLAIGVMTVGAVGAAVGGVLLFMNRGRTVYEDPTGKTSGPIVRMSPTRDGGGFVSLTGSF